MPFPNTPAPSQYRQCSFPNNRAGVFYEGQTPVVTLASTAAASVTYEVRDYYGTVLSTGPVSGTTVTPTAPAGGWKCGWYRFYMYGPNPNLLDDGNESFELGTGTVVEPYDSAVLADGPIRYYHLDETGSATVAHDSSPSAVDGTYQGTPTLGVAGVVGTAVQVVKANSEYITMPLSGLTTAWSLGLWWKTGGNTGTVIWRDETGTGGWLMMLANSDADLIVRAHGNSRTIAGAGTIVDDGDWHHLVFTSSGTEVKTYIDGSLVDTWAVTAAASTIDTGLRFGRNGVVANSPYYDGFYDEIAVYDTVLPAGRVTAHYGASTGAGTPVVIEWVPVGGAAPDQSTVHVRSGTKALHVIYSGGTNELRRTVAGLTIGQQYTFSAYGYSVTGQPDFRVGVVSVGNGTTVTTKNAFTRASVTFTATATSHTLILWASANGEMWWDDVQLETGAAATTFMPDVLFGLSAGATAFVVIRDDARFPANPANALYGGAGGEGRELVTKALMGMGTSRLLIGTTQNPTAAGNDALSVVQTDLVVSKDWWTNPVYTAFAEPNRERKLWTNFPNGGTDRVQILTGGTSLVNIYCKSAATNGANVFIAVAAGTSSGYKVTVATPTSGTIVETYDNIATWGAFENSVNANGSSIIKPFYTGATGTPTLFAATAIGRGYYNGIGTTVTTLYPDVRYYEGPTNEPSLSAEVAHQMYLFQAAVHAGNAGAKAIGPCPVSIYTLDAKWSNFLDAGGGAFVDAWSVHDYNATTNGNLSQGRQHIQRWFTLLAKYGQETKEVWQTEAGAAFFSTYGVVHPRRSRVSILHTLLWEQFGVPRERNPYWYDKQHGFWSFPTWWQASDKSLTPDAPLYRTLAMETFDMVHEEALSFGPLGDNIFLASVYRNPTTDERCVVQQATSYLPNASITYTVGGTLGPLTVSDPWGNTSSVAMVDSKVTVPVGEVPYYLRLPAGADIVVHHCNDWPEVSEGYRSATANALAMVSSTRMAMRCVADSTWPVDYPFTNGKTVAVTPGLPDGFIIENQNGMRVDRVLIWAGPSWSLQATLLDFDIQSSDNGTTWTTHATVTKPVPTSFLFGTTATNAGSQRETYWDEQWVFDVPLSAAVTAKFFRLYVRTVSYGGEPDNASNTGLGQGGPNTNVYALEVALVCDDNQEGLAAIVV